MTDAIELTGGFTVVLTSCGRFDLLSETVGSLLDAIDERPAAFLVVEDSGDSAVRDALAPHERALGRSFEVILNRPRLGQMGAIDRAYGLVRTPLVLHCEDDWTFFAEPERIGGARPIGFIAASRAVLAARPRVSMVGLRPRAELNPLVRGAPTETLETPRGPVAFFEMDPSLHPEYFGYSFNPGLRRLADALALSPFAALGREEDVSYAFKRRGFRVANLERPAVRHSGEGRHVLDPTSRPKPRNLAERLARSLRKRWKRLSRAMRGE